MTWITPLDDSMSALVTVAPPTMTLSPTTFNDSSFPFTVFAEDIPATSLAIALAATTWYVRTATSFSLFSGLRRYSTVPAGSLANASSVGANTVNGPAPFSVSTSPAALRAAASVLKLPAATAVSMMSFGLAAAASLATAAWGASGNDAGKAAAPIRASAAT